MTEIRSEEWRASWGLTRLDADRRVEAAVDVICGMGKLYPVTSDLSLELEQLFKRTLKPYLRHLGTDIVSADDLNFVWYALTVLHSVPQWFDDENVERVDFIVESNGRHTARLLRLHQALPEFLKTIGRDELVPFVGGFSSGRKESVPLQAADVFLWHCQRLRSTNVDRQDFRRYERLSTRPGRPVSWPDDELSSMVTRLKQRGMYEMAREHYRSTKLAKRLSSRIERSAESEQLSFAMKQADRTARVTKAQLLSDGFDVVLDSLDILRPTD